MVRLNLPADLARIDRQPNGFPPRPRVSAIRQTRNSRFGCKGSSHASPATDPPNLISLERDSAVLPEFLLGGVVCDRNLRTCALRPIIYLKQQFQFQIL